jgi:hypothetical protein
MTFTLQSKKHLCTYQNCELYLEHTETKKAENETGSLTKLALSVATALTKVKNLGSGHIAIKDESSHPFGDPYTS